jgi:hypothetical protein
MTPQNIARLDILAAQHSHTDAEIEEFLTLFTSYFQTTVIDPVRAIEAQIAREFTEFIQKVGG